LAERTTSSDPTLVDRFGRPVKGLRISVTPSCDLRCFFCHREGLDSGSSVLMEPHEIERVVRIAMKLGIESVKITGGEPMLRQDILDIVGRLGKLGLKDLSMTTNGFRLAELAHDLKRLGLMRVNISLHSIDPRRYARITGLDYENGLKRHKHLLEGVKKAVEAGLNPVKLNVVVLRGVNEDELDDLITFARELDPSGRIIIQLIELVGCGVSAEVMREHYLDLSDLEKRVSEKAVRKVVRKLHFRSQYLTPEGVWVEFVKPMGNYLFCMNDTRLRITHDGKFKPCLMRNDNHVDFLSRMRSGAGDEEIEKLLLEAVKLREPFWKPPDFNAELYRD